MVGRLRLLFGLFHQSGIAADNAGEQNGRASHACFAFAPDFQLQHFRLLFAGGFPRGHGERIKLRRGIDALRAVEQSFDS
jgi:hypothetical protein